MKTIRREITVLAKDIMTPNPVTIRPDQAVYEALLLMYQHDIRRLPVVEGDRMVGIISDRDIKQTMGRPTLAGKQPTEEEAELQRQVQEVMAHEVVTVRETDDLRDAIELMVENKFSGLPVVNRDKKAVGIISAIDVFRYTLDLLDRLEGK